MSRGDTIEAALEAARDELEARAGTAYPFRFDPTLTCAAAAERFVQDGEQPLEGVRLLGRIVSIRDHATVWFADLDDGSGHLQLRIGRADPLPDALAALPFLRL